MELLGLEKNKWSILWNAELVFSQKQSQKSKIVLVCMILYFWLWSFLGRENKSDLFLFKWNCYKPQQLINLSVNGRCKAYFSIKVDYISVYTISHVSKNLQTSCSKYVIMVYTLKLRASIKTWDLWLMCLWSSRHFLLRTKVKHETISVARQSQKWHCQV